MPRLAPVVWVYDRRWLWKIFPWSTIRRSGRADRESGFSGDRSRDVPSPEKPGRAAWNLEPIPFVSMSIVRVLTFSPLPRFQFWGSLRHSLHSILRPSLVPPLPLHILGCILASMFEGPPVVHDESGARTRSESGTRTRTIADELPARRTVPLDPAMSITFARMVIDRGMAPVDDQFRMGTCFGRGGTQGEAQE